MIDKEVDITPIYIYGRMGSGKTLLAIAIAVMDYYFLENGIDERGPRIYSNVSIFEEKNKINKTIKSVEDLQKTNFSFLKGCFIIDEGGVNASSRRSMSKENEVINNALFLARKKNLDPIFLSQRDMSIDVNIRELSSYVFEIKKIRRGEEYPLFFINKKKYDKGKLITQRKFKIDLIDFLKKNGISYNTLEESVLKKI